MKLTETNWNWLTENEWLKLVYQNWVTGCQVVYGLNWQIETKWQDWYWLTVTDWLKVMNWNWMNKSWAVDLWSCFNMCPPLLPTLLKEFCAGLGLYKLGKYSACYFLKTHLNTHMLFGRMFQIYISGMWPRCIHKYPLHLLKWKQVIAGYMIREIFKNISDR